MVNKIIIVQHQFSLTTAKTQRMLAAAKIYKQSGLDVVFVISTDDKCISKDDSISRYIIIRETRYNKLSCFIKFIKSIRREYTKDSVILFDGIPLYSFLFKSSKYSVFAEITEVPFYGLTPSFSARIIESIRFMGIKHFSGIQVISPSLKSYYLKRGIHNIEVVNMFVDDSRFINLTKRAKENFITYCGTLSIYKDGVDDLIKSFNIFSKSYPEYKLQLIGDFQSEVVKDTLYSLVDTLALTDKVIFMGRVNSNEMPQLLVDSDILVLARPDNMQAQYGFPTKLGEYLATGNPVVVTSVGDIPLFLNNKENALLAAPNDPEGFAIQLEWIIQNKQEAISIARRGKELVKSVFSSDVQIEKALCFYRSIVDLS